MTTSSPKGKLSPQKKLSPVKSESSPTKLSSSNSNSISRPSAEDLVDLERELQKLISRKIQADTNLIKIETRLYDLETEYLNETQSFGNLIHGIEGYLGLPPSIPASNGQIRRGPFNNSSSSLSTLTSQNSIPTATSCINPHQRIFSSTSTTFPKSLAITGRLSEAIANGYVTSNEGNSSNLTNINGIRNPKHQESKKLSPSKKVSSKPSTVNVSKNKKTPESGEWQPPSMKSSRKK